MEITTLKETISQIDERIKYLRNSPASRMSAMGTMIQEAYVIREWENLDEKVGKLRAELYMLENPSSEEKVQLVYVNDTYVVDTYSKNGVLVKGGLLENYFKGRLISEHDNYVRGRHHKNSYDLVIFDSSVNKTGNEGQITLSCKIGNHEYLGQMDYWLRCESPEFFQFCKRNFKFIRTDNPNRGLSHTEKTLLWYTCGLIYRLNYNRNANINLVKY